MGLSDSTTSYYWRGPVSLRSWLQFVFAGRKLLYMYYLVLLNPHRIYIYIRVETQVSCNPTEWIAVCAGVSRVSQWDSAGRRNGGSLLMRSRDSADSAHSSGSAISQNRPECFVLE